jgi:hypothetical protein
VAESLAWLRQAVADRKAAEREYTANGGTHVWCHAVAKYQQTVEKAIKAVIAALRESGFRYGPPIGFTHGVERHVRWLVRLPRAIDSESVRRHLIRLFDSKTRSAIWRLEGLAPKAPAAGAPLPRNTEYPFHDAAGEWTCPALPDTFSREEVDQYRGLACRITDSAAWVVAALRRRSK